MLLAKVQNNVLGGHWFQIGQKACFRSFLCSAKILSAEEMLGWLMLEGPNAQMGWQLSERERRKYYVRFVFEVKLCLCKEYRRLLRLMNPKFTADILMRCAIKSVENRSPMVIARESRLVCLYIQLNQVATDASGRADRSQITT